MTPASDLESSLNTLIGLAEKRVLIIGGGQGMGEATALLLAEAGCDVAVLDQDPSLAASVSAKATALGVRSMPVTADVTNEVQLRNAIDRVEQNLGPLDGLVTIVGMASWK